MMYATCLFCTRKLGANEGLETLPIGRRIAFDSAQGRLWVICGGCGRWNLVPFDDRLETIDRCEELFASTRLRFSTSNIGIARLREGLELVRIGPAQRPEFAAWRYGDRFASRRTRNVLLGGSLLVGVGGALLGLHALVGSVSGFQLVFQTATSSWSRRRIATRFARSGEGPPITLTRHDVNQSRLERLPEGEGFGVSVPARLGVADRFTGGQKVRDRLLLTGEDAGVALSRLLPIVAGLAGTRRQIASAVELVEQAPALDQIYRYCAPETHAYAVTAGKLTDLKPASRLALEMLANEESERAWLEGELKLLERQWREAERLAAIADGLALPPGADAELVARKQRS